MRKLTFLLTCLFLVGVGLVNAQSKSISGKVLSAEDGQPIIGATIKVKGTSVGTITNVDGEFKISLQGDAKNLVVSYVGMTTAEVQAVNDMTVRLHADAKMIDEVVVTAIGISRKDKSMGYSVGTVKSESLSKARDANVINSLAGKVAGVRVSSASGTLGGTSRIIIRGANSLDGNNQPLFIIDGVPVDNSSAGNATTNVIAGGADYGNRAGDINGDDIESMSILKGAAATALYGSRAKSGAVVITTKKGNKNQKPSVEVNSSIRFDTPLRLPSLQNEYAQGNYGVYDLKYSNGWGPKISDVQDTQYDNFLGQSGTLQAYPDNVKNFYDVGQTYMNSVSVAGGNNVSDYRVGVTALNQTGIVPGMKLDKYTLSLNAGYQFSTKFKSRTIVNYYNTSSEGRPAQSSNDPNVLTSAINSMPRTVDMGLLRDNWINSTSKEQVALTTDKTGNNPFWIVNKNKTTGSLERIILSENLSYDPTSWLNVSNTFGLDYSNESRKQVTSVGTFGLLKGQYTKNQYYNQIINNDLLVTATKKVNSDLEFKLILGNNVNQKSYETNGLIAKDLTVKDLYVPSNASSTVPSSYTEKKRIFGVFGDFGVAYKDYLYVNVTGRNDWSSTLPVNNRSYFYPSISSSFVFSQLLPKNDILNFGNLRLNWANVGSDEAPYQLDYTYTPVSTYYVQYSQSGTFPHAGIGTAFTVPRIFPNPNLKPQNQRSFEIGSNMKFLGNRLTVDFTYYDMLTSDQIISLDVPLSTGYFSKKVNIGAVSNKGIEVSLGIVPIKTKDFTWNLDVNFSKNKQVVEELVKDKPDLIYNLASGWAGLQIQAKAGESFGLYGTKWKRNADGEFIINANTGLREIETGKFIGSIYPDWTMGIANSFNYKGFNLSFLIDIRQGGVIYSSTAASLRSGGLAKETLANRGSIFIDKGVIANGDGTYRANDIPVQSMQDFWGQYSASANTEGSVFDASYIKLREISFSYSLPSKLVKKLNIQGVEFGVEARNLWIIKDHVPHIDPESNMYGSNSAAEGVEFNGVPSTKSIGFNLKLKF
jgi:TonB-linked SusC/RagA family outer membrane protein